MNSYYLYNGERLEERPEYDGENRWAIEIWQDEYPEDPRTWCDNLWQWAAVRQPYYYRGDTLPSDRRRNSCTGEWEDLRGVDAVNADDLGGLTHFGRYISVPIVGRLDYSYGRADLEIGSWQAVRDGDDRQLAEAFCAWEDARKWFGDLPPRELFAKAIENLKWELKEYEEYVEWGAWGFTIIDLLFDDDGESCGGFYGNPEGDCTEEAYRELVRAEQDTEGDHLALAYMRRFG